MADLKFTFQEKLSEVKREIAMRKNVYPQFIARGRLTQEQADRHIAVMSAIADDYERAIKRVETTQ
jgi:hypothetical protein